MSCYYCRDSRYRRKYCKHCNPNTLVIPKRTPDKTVLVIRTPQTPEEILRMNDQLTRYRRITPVCVYSSPAPRAWSIARSIAASFGVRAQPSELLKPKRTVNPRAIELLLPPQTPGTGEMGLYIFVTHEPHARLAYEEYFRTFYCVQEPTPITIDRGDMVLIDFTARVSRKV